MELRIVLGKNKMTDFSYITVIGAGSWGTAIAQLVSKNARHVSLVTRSAKDAYKINTLRKNPRYLPSLELSENINATTDLSQALEASVILLAVPTSAIRDTALLLQKYRLSHKTALISLAKGIERGSGLRMSEILNECLPFNPVLALSGPNHAEEISESLPACTVISCKDHKTAIELQPLFSAELFRSYTTSDIIGVEWGGAVKNVFAIAGGLVKGLHLGDNALAGLVTRGLAEMTRLGCAFGAREETFAGLSGIGDLVTTCYSSHSRNHQVGLALAEGLSLDEAISRLGMVAEGVKNTQSIYELAREKKVEVPLIKAVYSILYENTPPYRALTELFSRRLKPES